MNKKGVALITGASSGIGKAFAHRLALDGYDLILVARRRQKLEELAAELMQKYSIQAEVQATDLANAEEVEKLEKYIRGLERLDLLVNNAGFATLGNFGDLPLSGQKGMVHTHIMAILGLTHAALAGMIARRCGGIINVSSVAAYAPYPGNIVYSATKIFLINFSRGLRVELEGTGVKVQVLCPGFTRSGIHESEDLKGFPKLPSFLMLDAKDVVDTSLRSLGGNRTVVIVGKKYQLLAAFSNSPLTPFSLWMMTLMKRKKSRKNAG